MIAWKDKLKWPEINRRLQVVAGLFGTDHSRPKKQCENQARIFVCRHRRNPPRNALLLSPARLPEGSCLSLFTFPPPRTTSSGSRAASSRLTTSLTNLLHFCFPYFFIPRIPT